MPFRWALWWFMGVLVVGCAAQDYRPAPLDPAAQAIALTSRSLEDAGLRAFMQALGAPPPRWPLSSWSPRALFLAGLYHRAEFAVARAELRVARANRVTAARRPPLGINLVAEHHSETEAGESPWSLGALLAIVIPGPGQRQARIDAATARALAKRLQLGEAAWALREAVRRRFLAVHQLRLEVAGQQRELELANTTLELLEPRLRLGAVDGLDLAAARLRRQRAQLALAAARGELAMAQAELAAAVGVPAQALRGVTLDAPGGALPALDEAALRRAALTGRYDLRAALAQYAAADAALRGAIAAQFPDITLSPGFVFDQDDEVWILEASWLLLFPGYHDGPIAAARAARDAAAARFLAQQAAVLANLETALARYHGRLRLIEAADDLLAGQKRVISKIEARVEAGYADRLALLAARAEALAARRTRDSARLEARAALATLESVVQQPLGNSQAARSASGGGPLIARFVARFSSAQPSAPPPRPE